MAICIICTLPLVTDSSAPGSVPKALVCGHLFHHDCIKTWFTTAGSSRTGTCPSCVQISSLKDARHVYIEAGLPIGEEERERAEELELNHAQTLSLIETLKNDLREKDDIIKAMEASVGANAPNEEGEGDDVIFLSSHTGSQELSSQVGHDGREDTQIRSRFRFSELDKDDIRSFISRHVSNSNSYSMMTTMFIKSTEYEDMVLRHGMEPTRSSVLRWVNHLTKESRGMAIEEGGSVSSG